MGLHAQLPHHSAAHHRLKRMPSNQAPSHRLKLKLRMWVWRLRYIFLAVGITGFVHYSAALLAPTADTHPVVVTTQELPAGSIVQATDLKVEQLPLQVPGTNDPSTFLGQTTAISLPAGVPMSRSFITGDDLWRDAPPGTTVVAVDLADSSLMELLGAGDRIDLYTTAGAGWEAPESHKVASGALILAVIPPAESASGLLGATPSDGIYSLLLAISHQDATLVTGAPSQSFRAAISPSSDKN